MQLQIHVLWDPDKTIAAVLHIICQKVSSQVYFMIVMFIGSNILTSVFLFDVSLRVTSEPHIRKNSMIHKILFAYHCVTFL